MKAATLEPIRRRSRWRLFAGALLLPLLGVACSSDPNDNPRLGTILGAMDGGVPFSEKSLRCLDDYENAAKISPAGLKTFASEAADLSTMSRADLDIIAGAFDECVTTSDFAMAIAVDGSVTLEQAKCVLETVGGVGRAFIASAEAASAEAAGDTASAEAAGGTASAEAAGDTASAEAAGDTASTAPGGEPNGTLARAIARCAEQGS